MGDLKLTSASGSVTLSPENVAGTTTITVPSSTATLATNENFTSTGIDDNATSTAITIDSSEKVGIGTSSPSYLLDLHQTANEAFRIKTSGANSYAGMFLENDAQKWGISVAGAEGDALRIYDHTTGAERLKLTNDGRGVSQFTAKAWVNFNGTGTVAINDSHNVSSITDNATSDYTVNFANAMANANYAFSLSADNYYDGLDVRSVHPQLKKGGLATGSIRVMYSRNQTGTQHDGYDLDPRNYSVIVFGD